MLKFLLFLQICFLFVFFDGLASRVTSAFQLGGFGALLALKAQVDSRFVYVSMFSKLIRNDLRKDRRNENNHE